MTQVNFARQSPAPDESELFHHVMCPEEELKAMRRLTYAKAIQEAPRATTAPDPRVFPDRPGRNLWYAGTSLTGS